MKYNLLKEVNQIRQMMNLVNEQSEWQLDRIENLKKEGYVDVTDSFNKDEYVLKIADSLNSEGDTRIGKGYKAEGGGYEFEILTSDGKQTGYLVLLKNGIRGPIEGPIELYGDGKMVDFGQWSRDYLNDARLYYNEKLNQVKLDR